MQRGFGVQCVLCLRSWLGPGCVCPLRTRGACRGQLPCAGDGTKVSEVRSARGHLGPVQTDAVSLTNVVNV